MPEQKPLPGDEYRCEGRTRDSPGGFVAAIECEQCRRRTSPPQGTYQPWMTPQPFPCAGRVEWRTPWYRPDQEPARRGRYERDHRKVAEYTDPADRGIWLDLWEPVKDKRCILYPGYWDVQGPGEEINAASHQYLPWRGLVEKA